MNEYFVELAAKLLQTCPPDEKLLLSSEIAGAHHHNEPGKTGLLQLVKPETAEWMKPVLDEFQIDWLTRHPEQSSYDIRDSKQGAHLQDLYEALDLVARTHPELVFPPKENKG